jgi:hypothetical protein
VLAIGEGHDDEVRDVKPNPISESDLQSQNLKKVQQLLNRPALSILSNEAKQNPVIWFTGTQEQTIAMGGGGCRCDQSKASGCDFWYR